MAMYLEIQWWFVVVGVGLLGVVIVFLPVVIDSYWHILVARGFAAEIGKVVVDRSRVFLGARMVIAPTDSLLQRAELSSVALGREPCWRLLVDLAQDCDYRFEMWQKRWGSGGRIFETGEAMIGLAAVDERFWTDTTMPKEVAVLLNDPKLLEALKSGTGHWIRVLRVTEARIELTANRGKDKALAMFGLAVLLAHRMFELG